MIGTILSIIGIAALCFFCFLLGATMCIWGAYEKIKSAEGKTTADSWLGKMKDRNYGR